MLKMTKPPYADTEVNAEKPTKIRDLVYEKVIALSLPHTVKVYSAPIYPANPV